jgi:hypothetical protein
MKVQNMTSANGNKVANQFILNGMDKHGYDVEEFQSYSSIIVTKVYNPLGVKIYLDENKWDYSTTTGKYRNLFLGEKKKETEAKIKSGAYILADLNA